MKRYITVLLHLLLFSCGTTGSTWQRPPVWTIRQDCRIRASQRAENFSIEQFIGKIRAEEGKDLGYVLTPKGEAEISRHIRQLEAENENLRQKLRDCNAR